eukprot:5554-Heterococcus_DN1.PRE.3
MALIVVEYKTSVCVSTGAILCYVCALTIITTAHGCAAQSSIQLRHILLKAATKATVKSHFFNVRTAGCLKTVIALCTSNPNYASYYYDNYHRLHASLAADSHTNPILVDSSLLLLAYTSDCICCCWYLLSQLATRQAMAVAVSTTYTYLPASPSRALLWSCAPGMHTDVLPSQKASIDTSSPCRNSSITTCHFKHKHTQHIRMPCRAMKSLEKALLASSCAAAALGPKQGTPARCRASLIPATRGTSGPTTARATPLRTAN